MIQLVYLHEFIPLYMLASVYKGMYKNFVVALFVVAKHKKQLKCPSVGDTLKDKGRCSPWTTAVLVRRDCFACTNMKPSSIYLNEKSKVQNTCITICVKCLQKDRISLERFNSSYLFRRESLGRSSNRRETAFCRVRLFYILFFSHCSIIHNSQKV